MPKKKRSKKTAAKKTKKKTVASTRKTRTKKTAPGRSTKKKSRSTSGRSKKVKKSAASAKKTAKKKTTKKKATKKKAAVVGNTPKEDVQPLRPAPGEVVIRMYRQGLGDCFLLAFGTDKPSDPRYVLIDCGVHMRQHHGRDRLGQVMRHLKASTDSNIHVVVATHEHADHLSGFVQKKSPFLKDDLSVNHLWVAWTERFGDPDADRLRKEKASARDVIEKAVKRAREKASALAEHLEGLMDFEVPGDGAFDDKHSDDVVATIQSLAKQQVDSETRLRGFQARFMGSGDDDGGDNVLGVAGNRRKKPSSNELALGLLTAKADHVKYCNPGEALQIPDVPNVRAFALGPPRNERFLKKDLPSKVRGGHDHEYKETYLSGSVELQALGLAPGLDSSTDDMPSTDLQHPFAAKFQKKMLDRSKLVAKSKKKRAEEEAATPAEPQDSQQITDHFFQEHYFGKQNDWRAIDDDWLGPAEQLALHLDSDTNNTSLALAIELGEPGKGAVLLFPGDAQVGNWLSWREQSYTAEGTTVTADDLLGRTLLYKTGHHGSHNATLKNYVRPGSREDGEAYGLELMNDIIAMIPVDRAAADRPMPRPWRMPHRPLYKRLRMKSERRVLRADESIKPFTSAAKDVVPQSTQWTSVPGKPGLSWRRSFEEFEQFDDGTSTSGPLYYDIKIPISIATQ